MPKLLQNRVCQLFTYFDANPKKMSDRKTLVISGATKGIGRAIAEKFAENGYDIALNARNADDLKALEKDFESRFPDSSVFTMPTDMSKKSEAQAFGKFALEKLGRVDVLVNNAGFFLPGLISEEEDENLERQIETNLYSAYHLTRSVIGKMKERKSGYVFNICSIASLIAYPNGGSYSISKFALLGFSKVLREEMKPHGIRVSSVMPGAVLTNSWAAYDGPEERLMKSEDIADAIWSANQLSPRTVVEDLVLRPQLGDL